MKKQVSKIDKLKKLPIIPSSFPIELRRVIWPKGKKQRRAMVFHEKHGDWFFLADTPEEICYACLEVLNARWSVADNYGGAQRRLNELEVELANLQPPATPAEQIASLAPDLRVIATQACAAYTLRKRMLKYETAQYAAIVQALALQCPVRATLVVFSRVNYEHEYFDVVVLKDATK